jgi:putative tryptophan/tyrosine transport system substrate-binding protein
MGVGRLAAVALLWAAAGLWAAQPAALVAYDSGVEAFGETLEGLKAVLGPAGIEIFDLHTSGAETELARQLGRHEVRMAIAIGTESLAAVRAHNAGVPVIATMVLHPADPDGLRGQVDLALPVGTWLAQIKLLLPQRRRVGIIRSRAHALETPAAVEATARQQGYTAVVVDCDGPADLLQALAALKGRVDLVLCPPDADLYNSVTIKPLILASLEQRLPIVGFSSAFVRAGAVAGIYPDYRDIGRQTGELAWRILRGEDGNREQGPRKVNAAINQRVAHLLGVDFQASPAVEVLR